MVDEADSAAFNDWLAAEAAAYMAIHQLHQHTQGGRKGVPSHRIEQIAKLRKEADLRFASLAGAPSTASPQPTTIAPVRHGRRSRPAFELLSRVPVDRPRITPDSVCTPEGA
ncbi:MULTISPECIES: hypothetical protein [unclassified Variovorax]|jgi:hypothetical protein|uniref:hypothetical protein n=1 Tax=Variovorax TaxID=34072 RepID=UPI000F7D7A13|nr:hypothetical protein [Variovorax sp. 369]RTD85402.1 hypothetical protein EJO68_30240 [Variovorax sp. 369]